MKAVIKAEIVRVFETGEIFRFTDGDNVTLVAYQMDQRGSHRLAIVDNEGNVVAPGPSSIYDHPTFATFGVYQFMAVTKYFEGESVQAEAVYRLEYGAHAGQGKSVEEDGEAPERLEVVESERPKEPVEGWYIDTVCAEEYGTDLIKLVVRMLHTDIDDDKEIEETLNPDIGDISEIRFEEHGGAGKVQQSIVVVAEGRNDRMAEVQIEVDYETGEFRDESLNGWEQSDG